MIVTAEIPLIASAIAFATAALILALPRRYARRRARAALVAGAIATLIPLIAYPLRDETRSAGRALWEWSAVGGPTIQAVYRFDGLAAVGIAAALGYTTAGLLAAHRASRRHQLLPGLVLANGLVAIALAVTVDLIAATVVLGVVAALTGFAQLIVAPAAASARLAAFYAAGVQSFVLAALLLSRAGGASFAFGAMSPQAISPGVVLAASVGAALLAGLYPFIPWRYEGEAARAPEREPMRGILAMPAGVGATIVLIRLLGATEIDLSSLGLPAVHPIARMALGVAAVGAVLLAAWRARAIRRGALAAAAAIVVFLAAYPLLHWSHVVLAAVILTVGYAAAVSLSRPDHWEVVRYDVTLAGLWIGLATGTPLSIAAGLFLPVADALAAMLRGVWLPAHTWYIARVASSTAYVAGVITLGVGVASASDPLTKGLAAIAWLALLLLTLLHLGRELNEAVVQPALDIAGGAAAFLVTILLALLSASPVLGALADSVRRPLADPGLTPYAPAAVAVGAALLVALARTTRPLVPDLDAFAVRIRSLVLVFDPVPGVQRAFRSLESVATASSSAFGSLERQGGVWLATALFFGLLVWAAGP